MVILIIKGSIEAKYGLIGLKGLIGSYSAFMRNLVQIRSWVTEHPSKGFSNQWSYLEFQASTLSIARLPGTSKK